MSESNLLSKIGEIFKEIGDDDLLIKLNELNSINANRRQSIFNILTGKVKIDNFLAIDIRLYVLKNLYPDYYQAVKIKSHLYSQCGNYEYDPAKNGQNAIKHGLSFREVVSYSPNFGALSIRCPNENDGSRLVIFSDIRLGKYKLDFPIDSWREEKVLYVISIVQQRNNGFRFISSHRINKMKTEKQLGSYCRSIFENHKDLKSSFIERSMEILNGALFKN